MIDANIYVYKNMNAKICIHKHKYWVMNCDLYI